MLPSVTRILCAAFLAVVIYHLTGCTDAEFERIRHRSEVNERIRIHCLPLAEERIEIRWHEGNLICGRLADRKRGNTPALVATAEEVLQ